MSEHARLIVSVDSRQVVRARSEVDKLPASTRRAESAAAGLTSSFRRLGGVLATYFSVREVLRSAEAYTTITNRLRLVTNGSEELAQAQADLFRIAQSGRQPLSETAELYQRIATNQKELGLTAAGVARVTETISKSLAVSGTSAASAAGALTQLGQAFASGQLRGEELNSVLENAPALAQALAEGMGVTVGQLRALGADGELTARKVVDALIKQSESMDEAFEKMAPTVSGAVTTVRNSLTQLIGRMDETGDSSASAAREIMDLADLLSDPETIQAAQSLAGGLATLTGWLVQAAGASADFARWFGEAMAAAFNGPALDDIVRVEDHIASLERQIVWVQDALAEEGTVGGWLQNLTGHTDRATKELEELRAELEFYRQARDRFYQKPPSNNLAPLPPPPTGAPPLRAGGGASGLSDPEGAKKLASTYSSMVAALERQRDLFGQTSEAARIRYEIENGSLKGIAAKQAQYLEGLARELDEKRELTEQEELRIQILRESGQLRAANDAQFELEYAAKIAAYEEAGNQAAAERLRTLRQIREVQMAASQAPGTVEGVSTAPGSDGLDPSIGGPASELIRLQRDAQILEEWRAAELDRQRGFLESKAINEEVYAERIANVHEQNTQRLEKIQDSYRVATLSMFSDVTMQSAQMLEQMGQEGSAAYKVLFLASKAAGIAQAIVSTEVAAAKALELGPVFGIPASALVRGLGYASVGMIAAQTFAGAFDKGGTIPSGQWGIVGEYGPEIVRGPAMVTSRVDTARALSSDSAGGGAEAGRGDAAPVINIRNEITVEAQPGTSAEDAQQTGRELAGGVTALIFSTIEKESRQGGLLWRLYGGGR